MKSEVIVFKGVSFRRYPDAPRRTDRIYYSGWVGSKKAARKVRLHVFVWETITGSRAPKGYDVHHVDGDANNNPLDGSNYALVKASIHRSSHAPKTGRLGRPGRMFIKLCEFCREEMEARSKKRQFCDALCQKLASQVENLKREAATREMTPARYLKEVRMVEEAERWMAAHAA